MVAEIVVVDTINISDEIDLSKKRSDERKAEHEKRLAEYKAEKAKRDLEAIYNKYPHLRSK